MENEILDQFDELKTKHPKERHGCVTTWLGLMILGGVFGIFMNLGLSSTISTLTASIPDWAKYTSVLLGVANIFFAVLLYQWRKIGFFGFVGTSVVAAIMNSMLGLDMMTILLGMLGLAVLYGVFQIRNQHGDRAWDLLE